MTAQPAKFRVFSALFGLTKQSFPSYATAYEAVQNYDKAELGGTLIVQVLNTDDMVGTHRFPYTCIVESDEPCMNQDCEQLADFRFRLRAGFFTACFDHTGEIVDKIHNNLAKAGN